MAPTECILLLTSSSPSPFSNDHNRTSLFSVPASQFSFVLINKKTSTSVPVPIACSVFIQRVLVFHLGMPLVPNSNDTGILASWHRRLLLSMPYQRIERKQCISFPCKLRHINAGDFCDWVALDATVHLSFSTDVLATYGSQRFVRNEKPQIMYAFIIPEQRQHLDGLLQVAHCDVAHGLTSAMKRSYNEKVVLQPVSPGRSDSNNLAQRSTFCHDRTRKFMTATHLHSGDWSLHAMRVGALMRESIPQVAAAAIV